MTAKRLAKLRRCEDVVTNAGEGYCRFDPRGNHHHRQTQSIESDASDRERSFPHLRFGWSSALPRLRGKLVEHSKSRKDAFTRDAPTSTRALVSDRWHALVCGFPPRTGETLPPLLANVPAASDASVQNESRFDALGPSLQPESRNCPAAQRDHAD